SSRRGLRERQRRARRRREGEGRDAWTLRELSMSAWSGREPPGPLHNVGLGVLRRSPAGRWSCEERGLRWGGSRVSDDGKGGEGGRGRLQDGGRREIRAHHAPGAMGLVLVRQRRAGLVETRLRADESRNLARPEAGLGDERPQRAERDGERGNEGVEALSRVHDAHSIAA